MQSDPTVSSAPVRLFRRTEAAAYVTQTWGFPLSPNTLAKLAVTGGGPLFRKISRYPFYDAADLDGWVSARMGRKRSSTSDT